MTEEINFCAVAQLWSPTLGKLIEIDLTLQWTVLHQRTIVSGCFSLFAVLASTAIHPPPPKKNKTSKILTYPVIPLLSFKILN